MFCAPGIVFGGTDGVGSLFHVFHFWTYFRRYRGRRVQFSCFALPTHFRWYRGRLVLFSCFACPDSVFLFCALRLVFGSFGGFGSHFNVLHPRTRFRRYRGRRVPFSYFMIPDSFSAVPSASGSIFMFCAPILVFGGTGGIVSRLHVLRSRTRFRQ
jgi:hypothetical protein